MTTQQSKPIHDLYSVEKDNTESGNLQIRLPKLQREQFALLCQQRGTTYSNVIRNFISQELANATK